MICNMILYFMIMKDALNINYFDFRGRILIIYIIDYVLIMKMELYFHERSLIATNRQVQELYFKEYPTRPIH